MSNTLGGHQAAGPMLTNVDDRPVSVALEQARDEELHDMPEQWPEWVRLVHRASAHRLAAESQLLTIKGSLLWNSGRELFGALAITDATVMRDRAARMIEEASRS
jgi:hypothetical protein